IKGFKVLIIDSQEIVHSGIKFILGKAFPDLEIYSAFTQEKALDILKVMSFDLIIIEVAINYTEMNQFIDAIKKINVHQKILVFSSLPEESYGGRLMKAGVMGFVSKLEPDVETLKLAVSKIMSNERYISDKLQFLLAAEYLNGTNGDVFNVLTSRELEISKLLVDGLGSKQISEKLKIHPSTMGTHKNRIFKKLGVTTIIELYNLYELHNRM
ncbi:MAG TPA: response regulator transcription factor, partial [Saprospiraceae bacterium]|nr:response regulator transcription factor [Saprospiraceae bacterium]